MPDIIKHKVAKAGKDIKWSKAPGIDKIIPGLTIEGGEKAMEYLRILFIKHLQEEYISDTWNEWLTVPMFRKGNPLDLGSSRTTSLLSQLHKLLTKIITNFE